MGEGVFSSGNWGLVVPGSSSGFLTALVILMESCTVEGSLLQLVLLLWPKIDRVYCIVSYRQNKMAIDRIERISRNYDIFVANIYDYALINSF